MSLSFGWRANDRRESIWIGDDALVNVSAAARAAWTEDADASHLTPFATAGKPTIIRFRTLTADEKPVAVSTMSDADSNTEGFARTMLRCFRIGVDFEDMPEEIPDATGARHKTIVKERGIRMLASEFVEWIETKYPGITFFYGYRIFQASYPSTEEKKASSPPSTQTPSSGAESTAVTTAPSPLAEAVTGAP